MFQLLVSCDLDIEMNGSKSHKSVANGGKGPAPSDKVPPNKVVNQISERLTVVDKLVQLYAENEKSDAVSPHPIGSGRQQRDYERKSVGFTGHPIESVAPRDQAKFSKKSQLSSKLRNDFQRTPQGQIYPTRNASHEILSSRMNAVHIADSHQAPPNLGQHVNANFYCRPPNVGRNQWHQQEQKVSDFAHYQSVNSHVNRNMPHHVQNHPQMFPQSNAQNFPFPPQRNFPDNGPPPSGILQSHHAFPPLPPPKSPFPNRNNSPNSSGPMVHPNPIPQNIVSGPNFSHSPPPARVSGPSQPIRNELHYSQDVPQNRQEFRSNQGGRGKPTGAKPKCHPENQTQTHKEISVDFQKRYGKNHKKGVTQLHYNRANRQSFPATSQPENVRKDGNVSHQMGREHHLPNSYNPEVFVTQPNFVPPPMICPVPPAHYPPMVSPVPPGHFTPVTPSAGHFSPVMNQSQQQEQYFEEQQFPMPYYQGPNGNFFPPQWVPLAENPNQFVPFASSEVHTGTPPNYTSVPFTVVPYPMHTMMPYNAPHNVVTYAPPPVHLQPVQNLPSPPYSVTPQIGPYQAQFSLSQLERAWEGDKPPMRGTDTPGPTDESSTSAENCIRQLPVDNQEPVTIVENENTVENDNVQPLVVSEENSLSDVQCAEVVSTSEAAEGNSASAGNSQTIKMQPGNPKNMQTVSSIEEMQRMSSANGKRAPINSRNKESPNHVPTAPPEVQDEVIKFICDSWTKVYQEYQKGSTAVAFHNDESCPLPEGFVPFDLEAYWGQRLVQSRTSQNIPTQNM